ncbi:MAG: phage major capsid protein [Isosphaeraceae bacterium]
MPKPNELRQQSRQSADKAKEIERKYQDDPAAMPEEEKRSIDKHLADAEGFLNQAEEIEAREKKANDFEARLKQGKEQRAAEEDEPDPGDEMERELRKRPYDFIGACQEFLATRKLSGLQRDVDQELTRRMGRPATGFFMPGRAPYDERAARRGARQLGVEYRDLDTTAGAGAIATYKPATVIDALRNRSVMVKAGAEFFTDLQGFFSLPKQTAVETVQWVQQGSPPTASNLTIGSVDFAPKTIAATEIITRRMQLQPNVDMNAYVLGSIIKGLGVGVDSAGINGAVASPQLSLVGLLNRTGVLTAASLGADGGPLTWPAILALVAQIANANADIDEISFLTNAKVVAQAKQTPKSGTFPTFLMADDGTMDGKRTHVTSNCPSNLSKGSGNNLSALIAGVFTQVLFATWSGFDVIVDPYTLGGSGGMKVNVLQDIDMQTRYDQAFAKLVDIIA